MMKDRRDEPGELPDECYRCGYALHGIADDQPCPECGLLAHRSRRVSDELHDTRPGWLRRLSWGVWLLLGAMAMCVVGPVLTQVLTQWIFGGWTFFTPAGGMGWVRQQHLMWVGSDAAALMLVWAVWLLTTPEGYPPADEADRKFRRLLRWAAWPPLLGLLLTHVALELSAAGIFGIMPFGWSDDAFSIYSFAYYLAAAGSIPLPFLLFRRLRGLARRARSAHLAEHCTIVGVGASAALVYGVAFAFISNHANDWFGSYWTSRSTVSLALVCVVAVAMTLFVLWSIYLLLRFAIAFGVAASKLKRQWLMHDRSVVIAVE